jgi:DNA-binding transcriptional ArsR family regulator/regulator of replication initiation timing
MAELSEVLKTIEKLDKTLTEARVRLYEAKEAPVEGTMKLPDPESIRDFYANYILFKMAKMTVEKDTLTLRTQTQSIQISMLGILELLSNKFQLPVVRVPEQKLTTKPPFVENIDAIIKSKMDWIFAEFNKILAVDDPRINRLCQDYYRVQSYPLIVRLNYLQWEREFISYHLKQTEVKFEDKKTLELREIRKQYTDRLDREKSALNMRITQAGNELQRLRTINNRLDGLYQNSQTESIGLKQEIEALHDKTKGTEENITRFSEENSALKAEIELLKNRVNKYEAADWKPDFASTEKAPVFCNQRDNTIIKFPSSMNEFKEKYSLRSTDGSKRVYSTEGGKEFEVPDSLAIKLPSLLQQTPAFAANAAKESKVVKKRNTIVVNGTEEVVSAAAFTIYEILKDSERPLTSGELEQRTGYTQANVSKGLKSLKELGILKAENSDGLNKYYLNEPGSD